MTFVTQIMTPDICRPSISDAIIETEKRPHRREMNAMHADQIIRNLLYIVIGILLIGMIIAAGMDKISELPVSIPFL